MSDVPCDWAYYDESRMRSLAESLGVIERRDWKSSLDISLSMTGPKISGKPFLRRALARRADVVQKVVSELKMTGRISTERPFYYEHERKACKEFGYEFCQATKFLIPLKNSQNPLLDGFQRIGVWISEPASRLHSCEGISGSPAAGTFLFLIEVPEVSHGGYMGHVSGYSVIRILAESVLSKSAIDRLPMRLHPFRLMDRLGAASLGDRFISVLYRKRLVSCDINNKDDDGKVRAYLSMMAYPLAIAAIGVQYE